MAQPLRKIFQKNLLPGTDASPSWRERSDRAESPVRRRPPEMGPGSANGRRRTLELSAAAAVALALALVAAVGWSFFMGYLVGRGEHPGRGVEGVAGLLLSNSSNSSNTAGGAMSPSSLPGEEVLRSAPEVPGAPANAASVVAAGSGISQEPLTSTPDVQTAPAAPAYPFTRPQGEGLAAWGIHEGGAAQPVSSQQPGQQKDTQQGVASPLGGTTRVKASMATSPRQLAEPRFDYVFQAAAFRGPVDAERLRVRLEAAGLRTRVSQSGKVRLVLVSVRGSVRDADRVRGELMAMGLGRPIQLEKKLVVETTGGKSRRRSAP